jgi:hypothetical protein
MPGMLMFLVFTFGIQVFYLQGNVRVLIADAVEGSATVTPDVISLHAVEIAVRHRLLDGSMFQPLLAILQDFDSRECVVAESEILSSPLLRQLLSTCSLFDNLPCSIVEHLLSIRCLPCICLCFAFNRTPAI